MGEGRCKKYGIYFLQGLCRTEYENFRNWCPYFTVQEILGIKCLHNSSLRREIKSPCLFRSIKVSKFWEGALYICKIWHLFFAKVTKVTVHFSACRLNLGIKLLRNLSIHRNPSCKKSSSRNNCAVCSEFWA